MPTIADQITRESLELPESPEVREIRVSDYIDSLGDPSVRVVVVLEPAGAGGDYPREALRKIKDAIFERVGELGDTRFPYISFVSEDEI